MLSPRLLTTISFLSIWDSGTQNRYSHLLVTAIWWSKGLELQNSLNSSDDDVTPDAKDLICTNFVTIATWWVLIKKNFWISPNWILPLSSVYWTVYEFFSLLVHIFAQLKKEPFINALRYVSTLSPSAKTSKPLQDRNLFAANISCLIGTSFLGVPRTNACCLSPGRVPL